MREIQLTNTHLSSIIDDEDYDLVSQHNWQLTKSGHVHAVIKRHTIPLHRFVLNLKVGDGYYVDHIDDNGLNNQKSNLRKCTNQQNIANKRKMAKKSTSIYKGVHWSNWHKKWLSSITVNYKLINIGCFDSEIMAAKAYDIYADKYFGEFARLNFPDELNDGTVVFRDKTRTSKYYGVCYHKSIQKYQVSIFRKHYGYFVDELDAAQKANEILINIYNKPPQNNITNAKEVQNVNFV